MFHTTALGHQGWLIESESTRLLVDPLLGERLAGTPDDPIVLYPPRRIDLAAFPPVDAVVVTHEHPDHLNIPTLLRLDRAIPVLLSGRASVAARGALTELGFATTLLAPGRMVAVGDLEVHPFHSTEITRDEWDVAPVVVRDRGGDGSFATVVDAPESAEFAAFATGRAGRVGVWASSHNHSDLFPVYGGRQERDAEVTPRLAREFVERFERQFRAAPTPEVLLVMGSGFAFGGALAWMNRHVFPGRADHVAARIAGRLRGVHVRAPLPGHRVSLARGRLVEESLERPFLSVLEPHEWPPHAGEPYEGTVPDYAPACGRADLPAGDLDALLDELQGFARHLYGSELMRALYASGDLAPAPRRAAVGFAARTPAGLRVFAYRPEACAFEPVDCDDPRGGLVAGFECWASDLLAVLRLEVPAGFVLLGRCRAWNAAPGALRGGLDAELSLYAHPLRQPRRAREHYRRWAHAIEGEVGTRRVPSVLAGARDTLTVDGSPKAMG